MGDREMKPTLHRRVSVAYATRERIRARKERPARRAAAKHCELSYGHLVLARFLTRIRVFESAVARSSTSPRTEVEGKGFGAGALPRPRSRQPAGFDAR